MQSNEDAQYHRTAMARKTPSLGLKTAQRFNLLHTARGERGVILDYGCGRGDDVSFLNTLGFDATGYDPNLPDDHYYALLSMPPVARGCYDLVLCTFVLNVVEDHAVRRFIVRDAFEYVAPGGALLVTVRHEGDAKPTPAWTRKGDGWLTSAGTFQKFWGPDELSGFLGFAGRYVRKLSKNSAVVFKEAR
jgi:DNA phosphorothioation-associated putative methyltransferase